MRVSDRVIVLNNPVNYIDPTGLFGMLLVEAEALFIRLSQTPAAQRAAVMASSYGNQFVSGLNRLFSRYPLDAQKCDKLAKGVYNLFQKVGANPQIINITDKLNRPYFVTDSNVVFSSNYFHQAVRVGDMVYDGITGIAGMQYVEYMNKLTTYGLYPAVTVIK